MQLSVLLLLRGPTCELCSIGAGRSGAVLVPMRAVLTLYARGHVPLSEIDISGCARAFAVFNGLYEVPAVCAKQ